MIRIKGIYIVIFIIGIPVILVVYNFINNVITKPKGYVYSDVEGLLMDAGGISIIILSMVAFVAIVRYLSLLSKKEFNIKIN